MRRRQIRTKRKNGEFNNKERKLIMHCINTGQLEDKIEAALAECDRYNGGAEDEYEPEEVEIDDEEDDIEIDDDEDDFGTEDTDEESEEEFDEYSD